MRGNRYCGRCPSERGRSGGGAPRRCRAAERLTLRYDLSPALQNAGALEVVADLVLSRAVPFVDEGALAFHVLLDVDVEEDAVTEAGGV